jgi:hypothetical protein
MSDPARQELQALLYGEPPYFRAGAPEPEILGDLAPALPFQDIEIAFKTVVGIRFMGEPEGRFRALVRLLEPLPVHGQLFKSLLSLGLFGYPELSREVPEYFVHPALEVVQSWEEREAWERVDERRATILVGLASRFSQGPAAELLQTTLLKELDYSAEGHPYIYYEQLLVQSRLIQARVTSTPGPVKGALRSTLDYTLTHSFRSERLSSLTPYHLSVMLNDNGDGTHSFRFFGQRDIATYAHFDAAELQDLIRQARGALRLAGWGDEEEWKKGKHYRYGGPQDLTRLKQGNPLGLAYLPFALADLRLVFAGNQ